MSQRYDNVNNVAVPAGKKICLFYGQNRIYICESKRNEGSKLIKVSQECFLQQCADYDQSKKDRVDSGQIDTMSGQTNTMSGQTSTASEKMSTTSRKTSTTSTKNGQASTMSDQTSFASTTNHKTGSAITTTLNQCPL